jgi:alkaline phosphatase
LLTQLLPSGIGPEGFVAIPERGLIASANEKDYNKKEPGLSSHVTIYQLQDAPASYPHLTNENGLEFVSWGAISGMVAGDDGKIYAVNDGTFKTQPRIYVIDPSSSPALLERAIDIKLDGKTALFMDQEGITTDGNGGFYISTEGIKKKLDEHPPAIYHVSSDGEILEKITPPPSYLNYAKNPGFEGITRNGDILYIAQQKPWGDDTFNTTKILSYNIRTKQWGAVNYQLDRIKKGGVGISELTYHDGALYVIERDSFYGKKAKLKAIYKIDLKDVIFEGLQTNIPPRLYPLVEKELVTDLKPVMKSTGGFILEKVEGLAITNGGQAWISTDNDGTGKKSTGETLFLNIGKI